MSANVIIFEGQYMADQVRNLDKAKQLTEEAMEIIKKANQHRNWKCKETTEISNNLSTISNRVQRLNLGIMRTANALGRGLRSFTELEQRSEGQADRLSNNLREKYGFSASNYSTQGEKISLPVTPIPYDKNSFTLAKTGLSWLDKAKMSDEAGLGKDLISYLKSLHDFLNGEKYGLSGAADFCDLTDNSISLWTGMYEYLKDKDKTSKGLGIISSGFGLVSSAFEAAHKINSEKTGTAGSIGEVLGVGSDAVDFWGSIEKFKHVADKADNITTKVGKTGIYSPLSIYTAIGKGSFDAVSQGFKSVEKYYADGKWDMADTGRTGIESGVAGLYGIANSLTFGGIEAIGNVTGFKPENISRDIENWAQGVGERAGNYILNDSGLHNAYNNAGPIGKTAITFHAAIQSGIQSAAKNIGNWFQSLWS